jgi:hypothetical protein
MTGDKDLTGDSAESDGHRFILLQADGMVRVLQACKGIYTITISTCMYNHPMVICICAEQCTLKEFLSNAAYSSFSAPMPYDNFTKWWDDLKVAMSIPVKQLKYDPDVIHDVSLGNDIKAIAVQKVLGVKYSNKASESWFSQHAVVL